MKDATIVIASAGKNPPITIFKALEKVGWKTVKISIKNLEPTLTSSSPDCVIVMLEENDRDLILRVLETMKFYDDNLPLLAVSESQSLEDAVNVMKAGAYDYFSIPIDHEKLRHSVSNAVRLYKLTKRVFLLESQMGWRGRFDDIIGQSSKMQEIFGMVQMVSKSNATVLIQGESGTGKELIAKAIHRHSDREKKIFLDINCGAIPRELLENEMFGHERGSYTGADRRYIGSIERAHGGTLFLDEISEMDMSLQVKLLRFLQERTLNRIGGNEQISVDVRIVTATNRNLVKEVEEGRFREDLFYRLNVVPINLPPLRDRREDIPVLAKSFLEKYSMKNEKIFLDFAPQAMEALLAYDWPGNVRELENVIERVVVLNNDSRVKLAHFPAQIQTTRKKATMQSSFTDVMPIDMEKILPLELVEKYAIEAALQRCLGNVGEAAGKLKIGQATLYRKIKQYGLRV
ncbi:MAG: hypothetical protein A3I05_00910 [Deltaproteobacteria bacterium RIFCSPLOWO2_02_FULL_44_10]|nr:MAG: hypothetical protein A3C46_06585 [Deltaproteobacteria bacterium RIFCSPHIGHO2_02_FULL_44_16]OGQ45315.1 MAG: hypothetical protein A3I05_00910 [Deltaproteobacteria bacterium RIFCSPLOWO2_02_FULL_44_10]